MASCGAARPTPRRFSTSDRAHLRQRRAGRVGRLRTGWGRKPRRGAAAPRPGRAEPYLFTRRSGGTSYAYISRVVNGVETVLATRPVANAPKGAFFRMEARARREHADPVLDDLFQVRVAGSAFASGGVGLGMGSLSSGVRRGHNGPITSQRKSTADGRMPSCGCARLGRTQHDSGRNLGRSGTTIEMPGMWYRGVAESLS